MVFSLRNVLDSMVFGMSHVPGFSVLSIPVFISNYLFDLFSEFFLILTLFALAIMAFDGIRKGKQSLKEDAINLSLVIITVFLILQFKDKSVTYRHTSAYGIVTVYAGLLEKGEDIADALTYAMLFNSPGQGKYSPNGKRPNAKTPLSGIVGNSFFSFITSKGNINKEALNDYINERTRIIENQNSMIKKLFNQDSFDTVVKNTFNYARAAYVAMNGNKKPQAYMYLPLSAAAKYNAKQEMINIYDKLVASGYPLDKATQIVYTITDGQTPKNECLFFDFAIPDKNGNINAINLTKIEGSINNFLNLKGFNYELPDCKSIPAQIGGDKGLTYPYILKNELESLAYFWGKIYDNLNNFKNSNAGKIIIGKEINKWNTPLSIVKKLKNFYKQAANLVKNDFPSNANKKSQYNLIFKPDIGIEFGKSQNVKKALLAIFQQKQNIINSFKNNEKNAVSKNIEFINSMNVLLQKYLSAIKTAYHSALLLTPDNFLKGHWGIDSYMFPETFVKAYDTVSIIAVPYQAIGLTIATKDKGANVVNFYNDLVLVLNKLYQRINANDIGGSFGAVDYTNIENDIKQKINSNIFKGKKGPSLNSLVFKEYGYNPKVDLIFPDKKMQLNFNHRQVEDFLNNNANAYQNKKITWVDLGYYFAAIKAYTSNFIVFSTFALANNAFSKSANVSANALKQAINLAQEYTNSYNENFSDDAKTRKISESIANTMAFLTAVKGIKKGLSINSLGWIASGFVNGGPILGFIMIIVVFLLKAMILGVKVGITFIFYLIAVTIVLKITMILLPAIFWMIAVINWFFKSAMMLIMLPINVFLMFFKSRRQVFFQALWKLLAQMLTPVALVSTFFVVIVFSVEINFLLNYFIPFLNDNVIVYFLSDEGMRHVINSIANSQYKEAEALSQGGHWFLATLQYIKTWFATETSEFISWAASRVGLTSAIVKILGIILLIIKTVIVFIINLTLYMLFFKADDYIREILGEVFGATTGFDGSMERIMGKFGINKIT